MTSKERLLTTITHRQPDQIVVDFGSTGVTGLHVKCIEGLRNYYHLERRPVKVCEPYQMLGEIENDLADIMGIDTLGLSPRNNLFGFENDNWKEFKTFWGQVVLVPENFVTSRDANGDLLIHPQGDILAPPSARMPVSGYFFDTIIRQPPIDESKLDPEDNLEEFTFVTEEELAYWNRILKGVRNSTKGIIANFGGTGLGDIALVPAPFLKNPKGIRDVAEWYMATLSHPDYVHKVFEKQSNIAIHNLSKYAQIAGDIVDVVYVCGTDLGTQESLFCSPENFDELYKPYYRKINDWVHSNTNWKTFKHSCGAVFNLIPNFIDSGFDILNPVQINARGMDPEKLKSTYGNQLIFWGGGIDTQITLPFGSPVEVQNQVFKQCEIFGKGGGFVFNSIHNIQANVPIENILAMLEAIRIFNGKKS